MKLQPVIRLTPVPTTPRTAKPPITPHRSTAKQSATWMVVAALTVAILCRPASAYAANSDHNDASSGGFAGGFTVAPADTDTSLSYFQLNVAPGASATGAINVIGQSQNPITITAFPALGVTSPNSGDAYQGEPASPCRATSCWLKGLPQTFTLGLHAKQTLAFTVNVPAGVSAGQYLAGIAVEPTINTPPTPPKDAGAQSTLTREVVVGVAITVGAGYPHQLSIPDVTGTRIGSTPGLTLDETNTGKAFEHPTGAVTIQSNGETTTITATSSTILPGDHAGVRLLAPTLPAGTYPASAYLRYDNGQQTATWTGTITVPDAAPQTMSIPPGTRIVKLRSPQSPTWLWWVLIPLTALPLGIVGLWFRSTRNDNTKSHRSDRPDRKANLPL